MSMNSTVVFKGPKDAVIEKHDRPESEPGKLLVKTSKTLISTGTELTIYSGEFPKGSAWDGYGQFPFMPGYSNVGKVIDVHYELDKSWIGKRVVSGGNHALEVSVNADGVSVVPEGVADEEAAFCSMAVIAMNGVRRSRVQWGEAVVIYGLGLLGQLAARFCALCGARPVIGIDVSQTRIDMLPDSPNIIGLNGKDDDLKDRVAELTRGRMADIVFEITGNQNLINKEFGLLKPQGRFIMLSSPRGATLFDFHDNCNFFSYEIIGAHTCSHPQVESPYNPWTRQRNIELFFKHIQNGDIDIKSLVTHREPAASAPKAFEDLLKDRSRAMGVILEWE